MNSEATMATKDLPTAETVRHWPSPQIMEMIDRLKLCGMEKWYRLAKEKELEILGNRPNYPFDAFTPKVDKFLELELFLDANQDETPYPELISKLEGFKEEMEVSSSTETMILDNLAATDLEKEKVDLLKKFIRPIRLMLNIGVSCLRGIIKAVIEEMENTSISSDAVSSGPNNRKRSIEEHANISEGLRKEQVEDDDHQ